MKRFINKKAVAVGLVLGLAVGLTGAAVAYWTSLGTGDGSGTSASGTGHWTVTVDKITTNTLTPGGPTQTLSYSVKNNDTGNEMLHQVVFSVVNADSTAFSLPAVANANPQCTASDFSISAEAAGASHTVTLNTELAPSGGAGDTYSSTITLGMVDRHDAVAGDNSGNQDNCEGVTVPVHAAAS
jgi:hypothetical protein